MRTAAAKGTKGTPGTKGRFAFAFFALVAFFSFFASVSFAAFEDIGMGARVPGMGNVFTAIADDVYAIHYNPAGLGTLAKPQFTSSYSKLFMGLSDDSNLGVSFLGYAYPLKEGRLGSMGAAWQQTSLDSLYREQRLYVSYGRRFLKGSRGDKFYIGGTIKYLNRSIGTQPESGNALDRLLATGQSDPVLSKYTKRSAIDLDLGFLYRTEQHYSVGLSLTHLNQPNVAFNPDDDDSLPLGLKLGIGFRSPWMNLGSDFTVRRSPIGGTDKIFAVAAERWFTSRHLGDFGFRTSLGFGSRDFKQVTAGLSYRVNKIQMDYGFIMPLGTMSSIAGTHRIALTFNFGAPTQEEEYRKELVRRVREIVISTVPARRELEKPVVVKPEPPEEIPVEEIIEIKLGAALLAFQEQRDRKAIRLAADALNLDPYNLKALKILAYIHYAQKNFNIAIAYWRKALALEKAPALKQELEQLIRQTIRKTDWLKRPPEKPVKKAPEKPPVKPTPGKIQALYEKGVLLYTEGKFEEAEKAFKKVIGWEPGHVGAGKALDRIRFEKKSRREE